MRQLQIIPATKQWFIRRIMWVSNKPLCYLLHGPRALRQPNGAGTPPCTHTSWRCEPPGPPPQEEAGVKSMITRRGGPAKCYYQSLTPAPFVFIHLSLSLSVVTHMYHSLSHLKSVYPQYWHWPILYRLSKAFFSKGSSVRVIYYQHVGEHQSLYIRLLTSSAV